MRKFHEKIRLVQTVLYLLLFLMAVAVAATAVSQRLLNGSETEVSDKPPATSQPAVDSISASTPSPQSSKAEAKDAPQPPNVVESSLDSNRPTNSLVLPNRPEVSDRPPATSQPAVDSAPAVISTRRSTKASETIQPDNAPTNSVNSKPKASETVWIDIKPNVGGHIGKVNQANVKLLQRSRSVILNVSQCSGWKLQFPAAGGQMQWRKNKGGTPDPVEEYLLKRLLLAYQAQEVRVDPYLAETFRDSDEFLAAVREALSEIQGCTLRGIKHNKRVPQLHVRALKSAKEAVMGVSVCSGWKLVPPQDARNDFQWINTNPPNSSDQNTKRLLDNLVAAWRKKKNEISPYATRTSKDAIQASREFLAAHKAAKNGIDSCPNWKN